MLLLLLTLMLSMAATDFSDFSFAMRSEKNKTGYWNSQLMLEHPEEETHGFWQCELEYKRGTRFKGKKTVQAFATISAPPPYEKLPRIHKIPLHINIDNETAEGLITSNGSNDYVNFVGVGCFKVFKERMTWSEANKICSEDGAYLNIMNTKIEAKMIDSLIVDSGSAAGSDSTTEYYFVGGEYFFQGGANKSIAGKYYTIFGNPLDELPFLNWASGQPDNPDDEHCVAYRFQSGLHDVQCTWKLGFICEKQSC